MTFDALKQKSILILGFGTEGQATYGFLRRTWPEKRLVVADQRRLEDFPEDIRERLINDAACTVYLGPDYWNSLVERNPEVIIKTPGIPATMAPIAQAVKSGCVLTSHSEIFLSNYPREKLIGVTGTKGKSTTASLIFDILKTAGIPAELVGNIGVPPLAKFHAGSRDRYFVHEFSSHQLAELHSSPHIAVLLNVVPEHLDYYATFEEYVAAKENITRYQSGDDFLVFNADYPIPVEMAQRTRAALRPFSAARRVSPGCHLEGERIVWSDIDDEDIMWTRDIPLAGRFNVQNVMAAVCVARLCGVPPETISEAVKAFRALPHRLELVGTFRGITFYDDSIATVPDAALAALDALGPDVQTLILGGHERNLDYSEFGRRLPANIRTVILFPPTGPRIWDAIRKHSQPQAFFVETMEEAVRIAYARTERGKICLLSPAAPSFGVFKDYRERGEAFRKWVSAVRGA